MWNSIVCLSLHDIKPVIKSEEWWAITAGALQKQPYVILQHDTIAHQKTTKKKQKNKQTCNPSFINKLSWMNRYAVKYLFCHYINFMFTLSVLKLCIQSFPRYSSEAGRLWQESSCCFSVGYSWTEYQSTSEVWRLCMLVMFGSMQCVCFLQMMLCFWLHWNLNWSSLVLREMHLECK